MTRLLAFATLFALTLTACDTVEPEPVDLTVRTAADVAADPATRDPNTGQVRGTDRYTLFSLRTGEVVVGYDDAERADSASTLWDIGFRGTEVIVNGGASGPGSAAAVVVAQPFAEVTDAVGPNVVYREDGSATCPLVQTPVGPVPGRSLAVCTGSGNGWYTYTPFPTGGGYILPTPGRTLLVRLADGSGYAKVRFLSYYRGNPAPSAITPASEDRYYTFEFVTNDQGSSFVDEG